MGEYLELMPKEAQGETPGPPKRILHPETPTTTNRAVPLPQTTTDSTPKASPTPANTHSPVSRPVDIRREPTAEAPDVVGPKVRVLRPAQAESWQSSSFDLMTGLVVRDVTDTIPGQVFDELFPHKPTGRPHPGPRRRR